MIRRHKRRVTALLQAGEGNGRGWKQFFSCWAAPFFFTRVQPKFSSCEGSERSAVFSRTVNICRSKFSVIVFCVFPGIASFWHSLPGNYPGLLNWQRGDVLYLEGGCRVVEVVANGMSADLLETRTWLPLCRGRTIVSEQSNTARHSHHQKQKLFLSAALCQLLQQKRRRHARMTPQ